VQGKAEVIAIAHVGVLDVLDTYHPGAVALLVVWTLG